MPLWVRTEVQALLRCEKIIYTKRSATWYSDEGGVRSNPTGSGFVAIVHVWDNIECRGEPEEWRSPEVFSTEEEAMQYYKTSIRPALERMMAKMAKEKPGITSIHRRLE